MADVREQAQQDYESGMKYKDIAEKYDVSINTVKSWKTRSKWVRTDAPKVAHKPKKVAHKVAPPNLVADAVEELADGDLTDKQKTFVMEFVRLSNATQAYINAYGATYNTSMVNASQLLRKPKIQQAVKDLRSAKLQELSVTAFDLVEDMAKEARADIGDFLTFGHYNVTSIGDDGDPILDADGNEIVHRRSWVQFKDQDKLDTSLIKKITMGKDGPIIELHDRSKARDQVLDWLTDAQGSDSTTALNTMTDDALLGLIDKLDGKE